jgi:hypothetical protein
MKTILLPLFLLIFTTLSCRRPVFPKPGEPVIDVAAKPRLELPWKVMKGIRIAAAAQPCTYTTNFSLKKSSPKKF